MIRAAQYGEVEVVKSYLRNIAGEQNVRNIVDSNGITLLHWGAVNNRLELVQYLLQCDPELVNTAAGDLKEIPLQWCCRHSQYTSLINILLRAGSDVNYENIDGFNAFRIAVQSNCLHISYLLLLWHPSLLDRLDKYNNTALNWLLNYTDDEYLKLKLFLLSFGSSIRHLKILQVNNVHNYHTDSAGPWRLGNIFHDLATIDKINEKFDNRVIIAIYESALTKNSNLLLELNENGKSPLYLAWKSKNLSIMRLYLDLYLYGKYPSIPIISNIILLNGSLLTLKHFGFSFYSAATIPILYFITDIFNQNNVTNKTSKIAFGLNIGLIIAIMTSYCTYLLPIVSNGCSIYIFCNLFAIIVTLYMTSASSHNWVKTDPRAIRGNSDHRIRDAVVAWGGLDEGTPQKMNKYEKRPDNICHICMDEKPAVSFHCYRCGTCVLHIDHHCDFVNNCVDQNNRRIFIFFTFFASLGTMVCSVLAFSLQEELMKSDFMDSKTDFVFHHHMVTVTDKIIAFFRIEMFFLLHHPHYCIVNWMSLIVSLWIFFIFIGQIFMVMNNTTTYKVLKGHYQGSYFPENLANGFQNLVTFLQYGHLPLTNLNLVGQHSHHHHKFCSHENGMRLKLRPGATMNALDFV